MAELQARDRLLAAAVDHTLDAGIADLSLRELAAAIGTSHRMLLYHFGSREGLLVAVANTVEDRELASALDAGTSEADVRRFFRRVTDPKLWPQERLFFELYTHALLGRPGTEEFLGRVVESWVAPIAARLVDEGTDPRRARAEARLHVAVVRGLILDLLATGDRKGVTAAFDRYLDLVAGADRGGEAVNAIVTLRAFPGGGIDARRLAFVLLVAVIATSCRTLVVPDPPGPRSTDGFVSASWWRNQQRGYLNYARQSFSPGSYTNMINNAEWARRTHTRFNTGGITLADYASSFERMDDFVDTADFDLTYMMNLWYGYRDLLPADVRAAMEQQMRSFKYWFTDPQPAGAIDQRYYWSENHRLLFHADEYLAGQAFPNDVFGSDGNTGAWHKARAHGFIDEWLTEKARFGFTEWHSDVYYQKTADALLTIIEWVDDPALVQHASSILDLLFFDIALNIQRGNFGATHGRSYMKDKSVATDQDTFNMAKLLFDDTSRPYTSRDDPGATLLARAQRYRLPAVILRVAQSRLTTIDQEHMGIPLDPSLPVDPNATGVAGYSFSDPKNVAFWWEKGAQTAWQTVPLTLDTLDQYGLWESDFFKPFKPIADLTGGNRAVAQTLAQQLDPMLGFALLTAVDTYTYRSDSVMLSTAQSYRPGKAGEQHHVSQATLDESAIVFTTHPKNEPQSGTQWPDDDGYWTGNGSLPRAAQHGALSMSLYTPGFANPAPPLDAFDYLSYTHTYFPQEKFDEVVQADGWTFGRKGTGYVALYSWRPVHWRTYADPGIFTHGLRESFDLVADGGPDNVWLTQVGDAAQFHNFTAFRATVLAHAPQVTPRPANGTLPGGFDVTYQSPTEGAVGFGTTGPLTVKGAGVALDHGKRYDNPWAVAKFGAPSITIADTDGTLALDFERGTRVATVTDRRPGHQRP